MDTDGGTQPAEPPWDFVVSYAPADHGWAEWIAWSLRQAGYRVLVQAGGSVPGSAGSSISSAAGRERLGVSHEPPGVRAPNDPWKVITEPLSAKPTEFPDGAEHTIAVLSRAYLRSVYGQEEWRAAQAADPLGFARRLLPIRVEDCPRPGLLGEVASIDLFAFRHTPAAARVHLLDMIVIVRAGWAGPVQPPPSHGDDRRLGEAGAPPAGRPREWLRRLRHAQAARVGSVRLVEVALLALAAAVSVSSFLAFINFAFYRSGWFEKKPGIVFAMFFGIPITLVLLWLGLWLAWERHRRRRVHRWAAEHGWTVATTWPGRFSCLMTVSGVVDGWAVEVAENVRTVGSSSDGGSHEERHVVALVRLAGVGGTMLRRAALWEERTATGHDAVNWSLDGGNLTTSQSGRIRRPERIATLMARLVPVAERLVRVAESLALHGPPLPPVTDRPIGRATAAIDTRGRPSARTTLPMARGDDQNGGMGRGPRWVGRGLHPVARVKTELVAVGVAVAGCLAVVGWANPLVLLAILGVFVAVVVVGMLVSWLQELPYRLGSRYEQKRVERIRRWAAGHGWTVSAQPAAGVPLVMMKVSGAVEGWAVDVAEAKHLADTGDGVLRELRYFVVSLQLAVAYPQLAVLPRRAPPRNSRSQKRLDRAMMDRAGLDGDAIATGHSAFDRRFRVHAADPGVVRTLLGPELITRQLVGEVPLEWILAGRYLLTWRPGRIGDHRDRIAVLAARLVRVAESLAVEGRARRAGGDPGDPRV